jgi:hypothetical protein
MKSRDKGRLPDFVSVVKSTIDAPAWRALSHGARSLYIALRRRYHTLLQGGVYLSTRTAVKELGSHSHRDNVRRWFRELQYYGFIVMVTPGHLGVEGRHAISTAGTGRHFSRKGARSTTSPEDRIPDHTSGPPWTTRPVQQWTTHPVHIHRQVDHPFRP